MGSEITHLNNYFMTITYFLFVVGFVVLIIGANWLVDGAVSLGIRAKLSSLVIGLTVVAFGTSLPELVINVFASLKGSSDLAIGNILGSNIMNVLLILGVSSIILPITVSKISLYRDIPFGILAAIILGFMAKDFFVGSTNLIGPLDGIFLIIIFGIYLCLLVRKGNSLEVDVDVNKTPDSWGKTLFLIAIGCVGLYCGGEWVSDGALAIAKAIGISESAIGLTIVATATSLPELVTAIVAARKKNIGIVMGNVLGSNIINVFVILGISALINPLVFQQGLFIQLGIVLAVNLILLFLIYFGKGMKLTKWEGCTLIVLYVLFVYYSLNYN